MTLENSFVLLLVVLALLILYREGLNRGNKP